MIHSLIRNVLPPFVLQCYRRLRYGRSEPPLPDWEFAGEAWDKSTEPGEGWLHESIFESQAVKLRDFAEVIDAPKCLAVSHEDTDYSKRDFQAHNIHMCFAYVLLLAARGKQSLRILDWGGGLGQYYLLARTLLPELKLDYTCWDPAIPEKEASLMLPEVAFSKDRGKVLGRTYDLVMASGSFQYSRDPQLVLKQLAAAGRRYLYLARLPVVENGPTHMIRQRPHAYGYKTEYCGWSFNVDSLLKMAVQAGLKLERRFYQQRHAEVAGAPAPSVYCGFLFSKLEFAANE